MSLHGFQRALADCVASEALRRAAAEPGAALAGYALTPRERRRLRHALTHPGFAVTVSLYRANRLTLVYGVLPIACAMLGPRLRAELEGFWARGAPPDLEHAAEARRFAAHLRRRLAAGALDMPGLADVLRFELARLAVERARAAGGRRVRLVRFGRPPAALLARAAAGEPAGDLPPGAYCLLLDGRGGAVEAREVAAPRTARPGAQRIA